MELIFTNALDMSNIVKGENFGSLTDSMNNILESRDSDSI